MKHLGERERYIIKPSVFLGKTQMEVADEIQISQAQVSRLEKECVENNAPVPYLRAGVSPCVSCI